jgi:hypothetical protein
VTQSSLFDGLSFDPFAPEKKREHWLIFESGEGDICYIDPGYNVDVQIEANLKA